MEIGVTKAVQGKIKIKPVEIIKDTPLVFCWDTHLVKLKGRNVLLIVNASKDSMCMDIHSSYFIWIWKG